MTGISDNLEEFRELSKIKYKNLIESLEEKYCWKCPMRTNSSEAFCREVDSWIRLSNAFEMGVKDHLKERGIPCDCLEVLGAKLLEKKMKTEHITPNFQKLVFIKIEENLNPDVKKGNFIIVKENPKMLKNGDMVLLPRSCPLSLFWFSKISYTEKMPLKIFTVEKVFHKVGVKYIRTDDGLEIPLEYVYGVIFKIIHENDNIYSELHLKDL
jgi:hypothetical protein